MTARTQAGAVRQISVLARTFATRFFENEVTSSSRDLRSSFLWLIALLAQPGMIIPALMVWDWSVLAYQGFDVLRVESWDEKLLYLGYSMSAAGVLATVVWSALLLDRRDAVVLGVLPTTGTRLVMAKLFALLVYCAVVFVGMHFLGAFLFGAMLSGRDGALLALRGMVAHLAASTVASATVLVGAAGLQGFLSTAIGPARFSRISSWFQLAITIAALANLLTIAPVATALSQMSSTQDTVAPAWVMAAPVAWFLGLYETILGAPEPFLAELARRALLAFGGVSLLTVVFQPLAFRTLVRALVEMTQGRHVERWPTRMARHLGGVATTGPKDRAVIEFALLTMLRADRHRLTLAMGMGTAAAWCLPLVMSRLSGAEPGVYPSAFAAPVAAMTFFLVAVRTALRLPGDLRAAWVFDVAPPSLDAIRHGLRRLQLIVVVAPAAVFGALLVWSDAGAFVAGWSVAVSLLTGWLLVEASVWRWASIPAGRAWSFGHANLQATWPWYLAVFSLLTVAIPRTAIVALTSMWVGVGLVVVLGAGAVALARTGYSPSAAYIDDETSAVAPRLDL